MWPPLDPDKMPRTQRPADLDQDLSAYSSISEEVDAFKQRQRKDYERWNVHKESVPGNEDEDEVDEYESEYEEGMDGEKGWTNSDGDRLRDYGVDEEAEELVEEDIPLGELLRRRKSRAVDEE